MRLICVSKLLRLVERASISHGSSACKHWPCSQVY